MRFRTKNEFTRILRYGKLAAEFFKVRIGGHLQMKRILLIRKIINRPAPAVEIKKELMLLDGKSDVICYKTNDKEMG